MVKGVRPFCPDFSPELWPQVDSSRIKRQKLSDTFSGYSNTTKDLKCWGGPFVLGSFHFIFLRQIWPVSFWNHVSI